MRINAKLIKTFDTGNVKGIFDVSLDDEFLIHGVKLVEGHSGRFVSMPFEKHSTKTGEVKYNDVAHPTNAETRAQLFKAVSDVYENHISNINSQSVNMG